MKTTGVMVIIAGALLLLCLVPLAINSLVFIVSSMVGRTPYSLYGHLFAVRVGTLNLASYVSGAQLVLSTVLAVLVVIAGIVLLARARRESLK